MPIYPSWIKYVAIATLALCVLYFYNSWLIGIGENRQRVADQAQFDRINAELTAQKALAQAALNNANEANAKRREDVGKTIAQLEKTHAENQTLTDRNRTLLDAYQLRWRSSESTGSGDGGENAETNTSRTASGTAAAECELPKPLAESLAGILFDADRLRDDYALMYDERRAVTCY